MSVFGNLNPPTGRSPPQLPNNETKTPPDRSSINTRRRDGRFSHGRLYPPSTPTVLPHPQVHAPWASLARRWGTSGPCALWPRLRAAWDPRSISPVPPRHHSHLPPPGVPSPRHPGIFSRDPAAPSRPGAPCQPVQSFIPSATPVPAGFKPASTAAIPTLANPPPFATSPSP